MNPKSVNPKTLISVDEFLGGSEAFNSGSVWVLFEGLRGVWEAKHNFFMRAFLRWVSKGIRYVGNIFHYSRLSTSKLWS